MNKLKVFIASPSDVSEERDVATHVVIEVDRMLGKSLNTQLEPIRWETHAWPDVGEDSQDVINNQIGEFDILVGIMWRRFGTPTKRAKSGTGEEFNRAYDLFKQHGRPNIMFYFRRTPFYTTDIADLSQFKKVLQFRNKLEKLGVLYWTYEETLDFERNVREHLIRQIININVNQFQQQPPTLEMPRITQFQTNVQLLSPQVDNRSIFMAYSHEDRESVKAVYHALKLGGYRPWMDEENLIPGQKLHEQLDNAILDSPVILLFISKPEDIHRGLFASEINKIINSIKELGVGKHRTIIPILLENIEPPILKTWRWIPLFLPDGIERLLAEINQALSDND